MEQAHDRLIGQYLDLEAGALTLPGVYGLPGQAGNVAGYLSNVRSWISGNDPLSTVA